MIEVLLVLTLLAGAGFFLLVKLPVRVETQNLATASTQLVQDLRDVRQMAMAENTWYKVEFDRQSRTYYLLKEGSKLIRMITLPEKVSYINNPSEILFNASGMPIFSGSYPLSGTIILTNGKQQRNVVIALITGRVREEIK